MTNLVLVLLLVTVLTCSMNHVSAAGSQSSLSYRISESQLNDIAEDLFSLSKRDTVSVDSNTFTYGTEEFGKPTQLTTSIPRDGIIRTIAHFDTMLVTGSIQLKLLETSFFDYTTEVQFRNCSLLSEGTIDSVKTIHSEGERIVSFQVNGCDLKCTTSTMSPAFDHALSQYASHEVILQSFEDTVCKNYKVTYAFVFKGAVCAAPLTNKTAHFMDAHIEVINSSVLITQEVAFETQSQTGLQPQQDSPDPTQADSFEIWMHGDGFDKALDETRRTLFGGNRSISLSKMLPVLSEHNVQKLGGLIPRLGFTFPNSIFDVVVSDFQGYTKLYNNSFWIHTNITGRVTATLKCNPNRTYTAFKFKAVMSIPIQVAFNNKHVGMRIKTFRGNFTVFESQIGRVADRFLESIFVVLPLLVEDYGILDYEKLHGLRLTKLLPDKFYLANATLRIVQDYVVIGGKLTKTNNEKQRIPFENLTWTGDLDNTRDFYFPLIDNTPENDTGMPEQNCSSPITHLVSSSSALYSPFNMAAVMTSCVLLYFLSRDLKWW